MLTIAGGIILAALVLFVALPLALTGLGHLLVQLGDEQDERTRQRYYARQAELEAAPVQITPSREPFFNHDGIGKLIGIGLVFAALVWFMTAH